MEVMEVDCPRCEAALRPGRIEGVQIDECAACKGIWFERDELRQAKDAGDPDLGWMDFQIWKDEDQFEVSQGTLSCPTCDRPMAAVKYGDTGVEVDYCTQCQGVWLDGSEFEGIVDALQGESAAKDVSDHARASLNEARELVAGPESFVSEWRDLAAVLRMFQYRLLVENPGLLPLLEAAQRASASL
jgi:Zn-finger nucleic acid-binding protein